MLSAGEFFSSPDEMASPARIVMTGAVSTEIAGRRRFPNKRPRMMRNPRKRPTGRSQAKDRLRPVGSVPDEGAPEGFLVRSSKDMNVRLDWFGRGNKGFRKAFVEWTDHQWEGGINEQKSERNQMAHAIKPTNQTRNTECLIMRGTEENARNGGGLPRVP